METVVVYDKNTKEIIACVPLDGSKGIAKKDVEFKVYNGTEPVFTDKGGVVVVNENAFILNNREE